MIFTVYVGRWVDWMLLRQEIMNVRGLRHLEDVGWRHLVELSTNNIHLLQSSPFNHLEMK